MPYVRGRRRTLRQRLVREQRFAAQGRAGHRAGVGRGARLRAPRGVRPPGRKARERAPCRRACVLADFGIARAIFQAGGEHVTEVGLAIGTPEYMSPEQAAGDRELDGRCDVYALACVIYEMRRSAPVFGRQRPGHRREAPERAADTASCPPSRRAGCRRAGARPGARQGSGRPLRDHRRVHDSVGGDAARGRTVARRQDALHRGAAVRQRQLPIPTMNT